MTGITGITYCHNAIERDYCLKACVESMLDVCDEIVLIDSESTDGTSDMFHKWPKVRIWNVPFTLKQEGAKWLLKCINRARMISGSPFILQLDADEVIHEDDYETIKDHIYTGRPAWCWRHNFWLNPQTELPQGRVVGNRVVRLAPQGLWMPSDEPRVPEVPIRAQAMEPSKPIRVFHYGFLRKLPALVVKAKAMTEGYTGSADPRIDKLLTDGPKAFDQFVDPKELLLYIGTHPKFIHGWLKERGYSL